MMAYEPIKHSWRGWEPKGPARRLTGEETALRVLGDNDGLAETAMASLVAGVERRIAEAMFVPESLLVVEEKEAKWGAKL